MRQPTEEVCDTFKRYKMTIHSLATGDISMRTQIIQNLTTLGINEASAARFMDIVDSMASRETLKKILGFLTETTANKSKREQYYVHSKYISEFFCTISNAGLFGVGLHYKDPYVLLAAIFSALSHAFPLQRLHDLDIAGVMLIFLKVATHYQTVLEKPTTLAWAAGALSINVLDTFVTRKHLDKAGPWIHVAWHLAAAVAMYQFDRAQHQLGAGSINTATVAPQGAAAFFSATSSAISNVASKVVKAFSGSSAPSPTKTSP